jgi:hypothetical protein
MGSCSSSTPSKKRVNDLECNYDFYLDELREKSEKDNEFSEFEIVGKLMEYQMLNANEKVEKKICKYFFINNLTGKIRSKIKTKLKDLLVEGQIERKGKFKIKTLMECYDNVIEKYYEGQLEVTEKGFEAKGSVVFVEKEERKTKEEYSFLLDFTSNVWRGNYKYKNSLVELKIFMKMKEGKQVTVLSGISMDDKGISLWSGFIKDGKCTMQQSYIGKDIKPRIITYEGTYNKALENINGVILSRDDEIDNITTFDLKFERNPKKLVSNN